MKLVQVIKGIKTDLQKIDDLQKLIMKYSADTTKEDPFYGTKEEQESKLAGWQQTVDNLADNIAKLSCRLQYTNSVTDVCMSIEGKKITKRISEWIKWGQAKGDNLSLSQVVLMSWNHLKENTQSRTGDVIEVVTEKDGTKREIKFRRFYDPNKRDEQIKFYTYMGRAIDAVMEVVNAEVDLLDMPEAAISIDKSI
jgi:hypothetical protein